MIYFTLVLGALKLTVCLNPVPSHIKMGRSLSPKLKKVVRVGKASLAPQDLTHQRKGSTIFFFSWGQTVVAGEEESSGRSGLGEQRLVLSLKTLWNLWMRLGILTMGNRMPEAEMIQGHSCKEDQVHYTIQTFTLHVYHCQSPELDR